MNLVSKGAYALILGAALCALQTNQASALPMPSMAVAPLALVTPVACKYGSGKCPNVGVQQVRSVDKHGPQDPTKDPDCKAYGNCHDGPNGEPAAAKKGTGKPVVKLEGVKDESLVRKAGGAPPEYMAGSSGRMKGH